MTPPAAPERALPPPPSPEPPDKAAPPADALVELGIELARFDAAHPLRRQRRARRNDHLIHLEANRRQLIANYRATVRAAESGGWISPAGEWLLDNFHVIAEQLREGRRRACRGRFYRGLPELTAGPHAGRPRAFALAIELIAATDGLLDVDALERFLTAYQTITPLTIGELWAVPIALRHAFLDRLAVIAARVDRARVEREAAEQLADELSALAAKGGGGKVAAALEARVSRRVAPSTTMFATELAYRLRDRHPALALATAWLERRISAQGGKRWRRPSAPSTAARPPTRLSVGNVHHLDAHDHRDRLEPGLRKAQRRRARAAQRPRRRLFADGFCHSRSLSPRRRAVEPRHGARRSRRRPRGRAHGSHRARRSAAQPRRLLLDRRRTAGAGGGDRLSRLLVGAAFAVVRPSADAPVFGAHHRRQRAGGDGARAKARERAAAARCRRRSLWRAGAGARERASPPRWSTCS